MGQPTLLRGGREVRAGARLRWAGRGEANGVRRDQGLGSDMHQAFPTAAENVSVGTDRIVLSVGNIRSSFLSSHSISALTLALCGEASSGEPFAIKLLAAWAGVFRELLWP